MAPVREGTSSGAMEEAHASQSHMASLKVTFMGQLKRAQASQGHGALELRGHVVVIP